MGHSMAQILAFACVIGNANAFEFKHKLDADNVILLTANLEKIDADGPQTDDANEKTRVYPANTVFVQTVLRSKGKNYPISTYLIEEDRRMADQVLRREREFIRTAVVAESENRIVIAWVRQIMNEFEIQFVEFPTAENVKKHHANFNYLIGKDTVRNSSSDVLYQTFVIPAARFVDEETKKLWKRNLYPAKPKILQLTCIEDKGVENWSMGLSVKGKTVVEKDVDLRGTFQTKLGQSSWHQVR